MIATAKLNSTEISVLPRDCFSNLLPLQLAVVVVVVARIHTPHTKYNVKFNYSLSLVFSDCVVFTGDT